MKPCLAIFTLVATLAIGAPLASAAPIGSLAVCSTLDDELPSTPDERCVYSFGDMGSVVDSSAEARLGDGKLSVRSQRNGGETPLQSVGADVSDTIFFTGGDPAGFPVEISMLVQTYLSGEMAEMDAFMGMNIQSTDGSQVGGFAAGIVTRTEDGPALVQIVADWAEGWTVLDGGVEEVSVTPDGMLTRVSMRFDWQPDFNPLHFSAGLSLYGYQSPGSMLLESFNSGIELTIPEGVTLVTGSGRFLNGRDVTEVPAPASLVLVVLGLAGLLARAPVKSSAAKVLQQWFGRGDQR